MITVEAKDNILMVTLNRPEAKNALNTKMISDLTELFLDIQKNNSALTAVMLSGQGNIFCSGADLNEMKQSLNLTEQENLKSAQELYQMFQAMWQCPIPLICFVQGAAMGGALGLMSVSDYVVAHAKTQFAFSEVRLGLAPAIISDFIFQKFSVASVAGEMITGQIFDAQRALQMGLVNKVIDVGLTLEGPSKSSRDNNLRGIGNSGSGSGSSSGSGGSGSSAGISSGSGGEGGGGQDAWEKAKNDFLTQISLLGPQAVRETKNLTRNGATFKNQEERKKYVTTLISQLRVSPQGQEGVKSFFEKRKPHWS